MALKPHTFAPIRNRKTTLLLAGVQVFLLQACVSKTSSTLEALGIDLTPYGTVFVPKQEEGEQAGRFFITAQNQSAFALSGECSEPQGRIQLIEPAALQTEILCQEDETWSLVLDLSALPDGEYQFKFLHLLRNERRQVEFASERHFKITQLPPSMQGVPPRDGVLSSGSNVVIVWSAGVDSAGSPLESYEYLIGDQNGPQVGGSWTSTGSETQATVPIPSGSTGIVYVYIRGVDGIGQTTPPELTEVHVDDTAPNLSSLSLTIAAATSNSLTQAPMVSWNAVTLAAADGGSGSGVERVQYRITAQSGALVARDWTELGGPSVSQVAPVNLILQGGETYSFELRAIDFAGNASSPVSINWSVTASSSGGGGGGGGGGGSTTTTSTTSSSTSGSSGTTSSGSSSTTGGSTTGGAAPSLVDQDNSAGGFGGAASRVGVLWQAGLNPTSASGEELSNTWTPKYAALVTYLKFNGADESTAITDSAKGKTFSFFNQASIETDTPRLGGSSADFDGTDDRVTFPTGDTDFTFGTGDFTIAFWFYPRSTVDGVIYDARTASTNGAFTTIIQDTGRIEYVQNTSTRISGGSVRLRQWNHATLSRVSNVTRLYLNGVQVGGDYADSTNYLTGTPRIGQNAFSGGSDYNGMIDEFAIWKGQGLTSAEVLTLYQRQIGSHDGDVQAIILGADSDCDGNLQEGETRATNCTSFSSTWTPKYSHLKLYLSLDGTEGSTTFTDTVGSKTVTATVGQASLTQALRKVGSASVALTGGTDSGLNLSTAADPDLDLGTEDFAMGGWFYLSSFPTGGSATIMDGRPLSTNGTYIVASFQNPGLQVNLNNGATLISGGIARAGAWHHVIVTRLSGVTRAFLNGQQVGISYTDANDYQPAVLRVGRDSASQTKHLIGNVDEFALWKGSGLSAAEVLMIYQRQSPAFSGHLVSRVMDYSSATTWEGIDWKTTLPFGKPFTATNETSTDYRSLIGTTGTVGDNDFLTGFHSGFSFELSEGAIAAGSTLASDLGSSMNAVASNSDSLGFSVISAGRVGRGVAFDGVNDSFSLGSQSESGRTVSVWVYPESTGTQKILRAGSTGFCIGIHNGKWERCGTSGNSVTLNQWHHVVWVSGVGVYVDGNLEISGTASTSATADLRVGSYQGSSEFFQGRMDELLIWNRVLSAKEIRQLYRRGGNQLGIQVRSCLAADCSDAPEWIGFDNTRSSVISEYQNRSRYNWSVNNCSASLSVWVSSPSVGFSCLTGGLSNLLAERYFQYRVWLESDDLKGLCNYGAGQTFCSPELLRVEARP